MNSIKLYPSTCKRTSLISEISRFKNEGNIYLCGRLIHFDSSNSFGELRDWSGTTNFKLLCEYRKLEKVQQGDIVQLTGVLDTEDTFEVHDVRVLIPNQEKNSLNIQKNSRWQQLLTHQSQFEFIKFRSDFLNTIRHFFLDQGFIEIDAPSLIPAAGMEPHIEPFKTKFISKSNREGKQYFLHTSPEYVMKKMLVAGYEKIFYLGHTFRNEGLSSLHNPEFLMLEWYRAYEDYSSLMRDCQNLVNYLHHNLRKKWEKLWRDDNLLRQSWQIFSLVDLMKEYCQFDLSKIKENDSELLLQIVYSKGLTNANKSWPLDDLFFLLFLQFVEPNLGKIAPIIVKDYPIWMASLAKRKPQNPDFVERFELYIDAIELANAFTELNDPDEQYQRLVEEQNLRRKLGRSEIPIDMDFIHALQIGMPPSAGIALGVDRLMMVCLNQKNISNVVPFSFEE